MSFILDREYAYLVVIDESSRQVTRTRETRKAQRGAWATFPIPRNPRCTVSWCVCVASLPHLLLQPITYPTQNPGRPPIVRPCPLLFYPFYEHGNSYFPCRASSFSLGAAWFCSLWTARFCSSTASSASRLVERPFDVRPANRFITRGIFAPSLLAPLSCLLACLRRRYDKAPKFSRSRETRPRAFRPSCVSLYKTLSKRKHHSVRRGGGRRESRSIYDWF